MTGYSFEMATSQEEMGRALEKLLALHESGELEGVALRIYNADGTWQDLVFGDEPEQRAEALAALRRAYAQAN